MNETHLALLALCADVAALGKNKHVAENLKGMFSKVWREFYWLYSPTLIPQVRSNNSTSGLFVNDKNTEM